jgi:hypothetical protein
MTMTSLREAAEMITVQAITLDFGNYTVTPWSRTCHQRWMLPQLAQQHLPVM